MGIPKQLPAAFTDLAKQPVQFYIEVGILGQNCTSQRCVNADGVMERLDGVRALSVLSPDLSGDAAALPGGAVMAAQLRVYAEPEDESFGDSPEPTQRIRLGDLLPLVALAHRNHYLWLRDFLDDEVQITPDLYEVLQAFQCYRPSA